MAFSLRKFLTEVYKISGDEYLPCTLYQMILSIQMHCEMHKVYWKLLGKGSECLNDLYYTLDNIMKHRTPAGLGRKTSATVVSIDTEEKMWSKGILGDSNPRQLSDTLLYLLGINLALCRDEEHHRLCRPGFGCQLRVGKDSDGICCLIFEEDVKTKTNQGSLDRCEN